MVLIQGTKKESLIMVTPFECIAATGQLYYCYSKRLPHDLKCNYGKMPERLYEKPHGMDGYSLTLLHKPVLSPEYGSFAAL